MSLTKKNQQLIGIVFIAIAICIQLFSDVSCYEMTLGEAAGAFAFASIVLLPAIIFMFSSKPLRSAGAAAVAALFYGWAYYVDCVQPYQGGGASMIYVAVILWGTPLAVAVGFLVGWFTEALDA